MNKLFFILIAFLFFSCKKDSKRVLENESIANTEAIEVAKPQDTIAYFENALIYQYEQNEVKEELWLYVNEQKKEILFVPNDDMIQAVISYPDGTFKIFGTNEKGEKVILTQKISAVFGEELDDDVLKKMAETKTISQKNIQQKDILCEGFSLKYLKMEGGETLFATTQIPINSFQIYAFSRLDGDCKLPISLDYINVFKKNQLITHIERDNFTLELLNYGPNPYEFQLKEYK